MKEEFQAYLLDSQLHIKTVGRDEEFSTTHYFPYEPSSYEVLERVAESPYLDSTDVVIDYGCGKGRVPIYLNDKLGCKAMGVEVVEAYYQKACENAISYQEQNTRRDVSFYHEGAEHFALPEDVSACFFFNPFDIGIFRGVMKQLQESVVKNPRRIRMFFYYPHEDYVAFLSAMPEVEFVDEINCQDLFEPKDKRNTVLVFDLI